MGEVGSGMSPSEAVISGHDVRHNGAPFVNQIFTGPNGGAAAPATDGWLTMSDLGSGGTLLLDSVEIDELKQPIVVHERRLAIDTEGAGHRRGAPGMRVEYGPVAGELEAIYANDGSINPMAGARGGHAGAPSTQQKRRADGSLVAIDICGPELVVAGERLVARTTGGGGYGDPATREPELVVADVLEGWITPERARDVYRVQLVDGLLDSEATVALRSGTRANGTTA
jgi:N-methylhydantoinase B